MFNYLEFEDKITANPLRKMRINIKEPKRLPKVMDIREIRKIFNSAYEENSLAVNGSSYGFFETLRNIVVVELLFATGARVSEIANLKTENIEIAAGTITIKGKGNKERIIQVCNYETLKILKDYHRLYNDRINNSGGFFLIKPLNKSIPTIFFSETNNSISNFLIYNLPKDNYMIMKHMNII